MLREIISQIASMSPDLEVITPRRDKKTLSEVIKQSSPDVIITGETDEELDSTLTDFLMGHAKRKVLGVSADGRSASIYILRPDYVSLGEISRERLLQAIRYPSGWH